MFSSKEVRLLSWNADGVRNKIHDLLDLVVHNVSVDIVTICETKLTHNIIFPTQGYNLYCQDKVNSDRGQDVVIMVKSCMDYSRVRFCCYWKHWSYRYKNKHFWRRIYDCKRLSIPKRCSTSKWSRHIVKTILTNCNSRRLQRKYRVLEYLLA